METVGLAAKLSFDGGAAVTGMGKAKTAFDQLKNSAKQAKDGVKNIKAGFSGLSLLTGAAGAGAAFAVKKYADFAGQMGALKAVLGNEAAPMFDQLEAMAVKLGAETVFTSKDAAAAMENLARAGFDANEILASTPAVLSAAAAEGMDLATAADIVASNMRAFGMQAKDSGHIADVLAVVSAKTATSIVELQEGLKYAAPVARTAGTSFEQTASILGILSDVGIKATLSGTAFKNAIIQMAKHAEKGVIPVTQNLSAAVEMNAQGGIDAQKSFTNLMKAIATIPDPLERVQAGMQILGIRGQAVTTAFEAMNADKATQLFDNLKDGVKGAADNMAKLRLANLQGDFILLKSSIDLVAQSIGNVLRPTIQSIINGPTGLTAFANNVVAAFNLLGKESTLGASVTEYQLGQMDQTAVGFARGIRDGVEGAKSVFRGLGTVVEALGRGFNAVFNPTAIAGSNGPSIQSMIKLGIEAVVLAGGIKLIGGALGRMASVAKGTFQVLSGTFGMLKTGTSTVMGKLVTKFPGLAKVLPGGMKKLAGAAHALDKMNAQPVRIVNWDEAPAGLGGAGGLLPGSTPTTNMPDITNSELAKKTGKFGKVLGGAGKVLGVLGAVTAGAAIGWEAGRFIDETFGLSDRISGLKARQEQADKNVKKFSNDIAYENVKQQAQQLIDLQKSVGSITTADGEKVQITQEMATKRLTEYATKIGKDKKETDALLASVYDMINKLPTAIQKGMSNVKIETKTNLDGKDIGRSTASIADEENARRNGPSKPGERLRKK